MPELSVIIPVYNTDRYLERCLESICAQTFRDIEIICIDDASTDGSRTILQDFASRDSRIRLILRDRNGGVSAARNLGIEASQGDWLGFVDSDDFLDGDYFEKLLSEAKASGADMVKGTARTYDTVTGETGTAGWLDTNGRIRTCKAYFTAGFFMAIYKASLVREGNIRFPEGLNYFEESCFVIEAVQKCRLLTLRDDAVYNYVLSPGSITRKPLEISLLESLRKGTDLTVRMLSDVGAPMEDTIIVYRYILSLLMMFLNHLMHNEQYPGNELILSVSRQMAELSEKCPDSEKMYVDYFLGLRQGYNM